MNKYIIIVAVLVSSIAFAKTPQPIQEEKLKDESCGYVAVGGIAPTFTVGGRINIVENNFIDISGGFATLGKVHQFDLTLRDLVKYSGNKYVGGGLEGVVAFNKYGSFSGLSAITTHGWDRPKDFTEVSLSFPLYKIEGHMYVPHFIIKYGWKF